MCLAVLHHCTPCFPLTQDLVVETRASTEEWAPYDPDAIMLKIIKYDAEKDELLPEVRARAATTTPGCRCLCCVCT